MARYVYRFSILGARPLDPMRLAAVVGPVFGRLGFTSGIPSVTELKGLPPPVLLPASGVGTEDERAATYAVDVPPWGQVILYDDSPAAGAIRTLTKLSMEINGTLPPDTRRSGRAQVSDAVNAEINRVLAPEGYFNLTGGGRDAGFVDAGGRRVWPFVVGGVVLGGLAAWFSESQAAAEF